MTFPRRQFLRFAAGAAAAAASGSARAQAYPVRSITMVVPIAAGGAVDTTGRIIADQLQGKLGQPVVVENRPGAGSIIGASYVAKSAPDGYTLLLMEPGVVMAKWLSKTVPFDVIADFAPIALVAASPLVLFANLSVPFKDVGELIAYSRAHPGQLSVGTPGVGSPHHMAAAWLNSAAKIQITHVAYRGAAPALNDLLGGQIELLWATPVAVLPFLAQGKVKALAVSTAQRDRMLPQVPTIAETAVPGFDINAWLGVAAPAGVPPDAASRLKEAIRDIIGTIEVQKRLATLGLNFDFRDSEHFRALIAADHTKYGAIAREAGIQPI